MNRSDVLPRTFFLLCLLVGGWAASARAWTTETYDNLGLKDAGVIADASTIGNFKYYTSSGEGIYVTNNAQYSSAMIGPNFRNIDPITFSFKRPDGSAFRLQSIGIIADADQSSASIVIRGFKNGAKVIRSAVDARTRGNTTLTFGLNWTDIDSVVISDSTSGSGLWIQVDNIVWEAYALPTVATGTKSGVTATAATLAGTVNANNTTTADSIQYGLTSNYGTTVVATPPTATGASATPISASLSGLTPNTTYHYRVKATNSTAPAAEAIRPSPPSQTRPWPPRPPRARVRSLRP
jgi:hypothetical protein